MYEGKRRQGEGRGVDKREKKKGRGRRAGCRMGGGSDGKYESELVSSTDRER